MQNLIDAFKKSKELKYEDYPSFNAGFKAKMKIEEPLAEWSSKEFQKACKIKGFNTIADIHGFVYRNDMNGNLETSDKLSILFEDDEIVVKAIIDYDCDTTMCKYSVKHKVLGFAHRDAIDLGKQYLSGGFQINI